MCRDSAPGKCERVCIRGCDVRPKSRCRPGGYAKAAAGEKKVSTEVGEFWCDNLRHHWQESIQKDYPAATEMLLLMDGGGSHSCLHYIVKEDLQNLADELKIKLTVAHYPAYCSKYNPIEHRLFPHLQRSWEGVVFENYELV